MSTDIKRFTEAQEKHFEQALSEIKAGRKRSHWMWYIFPQVKGLGYSETAKFYAIEDIDEAKVFLNDEYLGGNLREICSALLNLKTDNVDDIFGYPDDLKLRSSMTLFVVASNGEQIFMDVLTKYFQGKLDTATFEMLKTQEER